MTTKLDANRAKMLEAFWKLSEFNTNSRLEGLKQIEEYIDKLNVQENKEDLNYILKRLIRGLVSNRKCSRLGFSCTLTDLLNKYDAIKIDDLFEISENEYKLDGDDKKSLTNEEISGTQIATAFLYLCIAQSNRLNDKEDIEKMLKKLNDQWKNNKMKLYLRELYLQTFTLVIRKVDSEYFTNKILPDLLENEFKQGWSGDETTKFIFQLLLFSLNNYSDKVQLKNIKKYWGSTNLLNANEDKLYEYLSNSSESLPNLSPFCAELMNYALKQSNFNEFWLKMIDNKLIGKQEKKKILAYKLLVYCIKNLKIDQANLIDSLMSPNLVQTLVKNYSLKTNINGIVHGIFKELIEVLRLKEAEFISHEQSLCANVAIQIMNMQMGKSQFGDMIHQILSVSNQFGLAKYFSYLVGHIKVATKSDADNEANDNTQIILLNQISSFTKNDNFSLNNELTKDVLLLLIFNLYFEQNDNDETQVIFFKDRNDKFEALLKDCLFKMIAYFITKENFDPLHKIIKTLSEKVFDKNKFSVKLNDKYVKKSNEIKQQTNKLFKIMNDIQKSNDSDEVVNQVFMMIATFEAFRMFESLKSSIDSINDLAISYEKSKKSIDTTNEDEPQWIDIILEMLLTLYTINNKHIRNAVQLLFKKLIPTRLTQNSVDLLFDLFEPEADDELLVDDDEEMNDDEDDEDESGIEDVSPTSSKNSDESTDDDIKEIKQNGKENSDESDTGDEDADDENNVALDEELRKAVDQALGDAVAQDSEQSDLDDDAMMKLDEALSSAFKLKKRGKQREIDVLQFKSKILDLIHEIFKSQTRVDLIIHSIKPMLEMLFESQKKSNLKLLSQRILSMLKSVKNMRKLTDAKLPQIDEIFEVLKYVITCSTTQINGTHTVTEITTFLVRLIQNISNNETIQNKKEIENRLSNVYSELIKNFYVQSESKVNPAIHQEFLLRFPSYSLPLFNQMIDLSSQSDIKIHKKTITLGILYQTINIKMFTDAETCTIQQFTKKIFDFFNQIVSKIIQEDNVHVKFIDSFLNLVNRVLNLQSIQIDKELVEVLGEKLIVLSKENKIKQAMKSRCLNLIHTCHLKYGIKIDEKNQSKKLKKRKNEDATQTTREKIAKIS